MISRPERSPKRFSPPGLQDPQDHQRDVVLGGLRAGVGPHPGYHLAADLGRREVADLAQGVTRPVNEFSNSGLQPNPKRFL